VGPRAGLNNVKTRKFLPQNSDPSVVQPVASRYSDYAILALSFPSEVIWIYGSYGQPIGILGWVISSVAEPLPTQDNTNTEETQTEIHASSVIQTHDSSV
jgi:hypothetical protein